MLLELELDVLLLELLDEPFSNWEKSACNWASSVCSSVERSVEVELSLLLALVVAVVLALVEAELSVLSASVADGGGGGGPCSWANRASSALASSVEVVLALLVEDALLSVELALTELVLALVEDELPSAPGGGGGGCCRSASSCSSTLANWDELSLLLVEVEALVALDALVASLDVLSLAERPDRKLMFNSWKYAGGVGAVWLSSADVLLLSLLSLDALLLVEADVC